MPDKLAQLLSKLDLEGAEPAGTDVTPDGLKIGVLRDEVAPVYGFAAGTRTPAILGRMIDHTSGSRAALPSPRPLRTVRESFPSHDSSLSLARFQTQLPYGHLVRMHLLVAGGME